MTVHFLIRYGQIEVPDGNQGEMGVTLYCQECERKIGADDYYIKVAEFRGHAITPTLAVLCVANCLDQVGKYLKRFATELGTPDEPGQGGR